MVAEVRRRWSEAEKQVIVAEAARLEANISAVARRHGIADVLTRIADQRPIASPSCRHGIESDTPAAEADESRLSKSVYPGS